MLQPKLNRSGMFLLELLVSVLIFAIASAICLQLFAASHTHFSDSRTLDEAASLADSTAACIRAGADSPTALSAYYADSVLSGTYFYRYLNSNWDPAATPEQASFCLQVSFPESDALLREALITITRAADARQLITLKVQVHPPLSPKEVPS